MSQLPQGPNWGGILSQGSQQQPYMQQPMSGGMGGVSPYLQAQMFGGAQTGGGGLSQQQMMGLASYDPMLLAAMSGNVMMAGGGLATQPTMAMVGEGDAPEYVIPTDPKYRGRAKQLLKGAQKAISGGGRRRRPLSGIKGGRPPAAVSAPPATPGVPQMAGGGAIGPAPYGNWNEYGGWAPQGLAGLGYGATPQSWGPGGTFLGYPQQGGGGPQNSGSVVNNVRPMGLGAGTVPGMRRPMTPPRPQGPGILGESPTNTNFTPNGYGGYTDTLANVANTVNAQGMNQFGYHPAQTPQTSFAQQNLAQAQAGQNPYAAQRWAPNPSWNQPAFPGQQPQRPGQISAGPMFNSPGRLPRPMASGGILGTIQAGINSIIGGGGLLGAAGLSGPQQAALARIYRQQLLGGPSGGYNRFYPGYGRSLFGMQQPQMNADMLSAYLPQLYGGGGAGRRQTGGALMSGPDTSGNSISTGGQDYQSFVGPDSGLTDIPPAPVNYASYQAPYNPYPDGTDEATANTYARGGIIRHLAGGGVVAPAGVGAVPGAFGGAGGAAPAGAFAGIGGGGSPYFGGLASAPSTNTMAPAPNMGPFQRGPSPTTNAANLPTGSNSPLPSTPGSYNLGGQLTFPNTGGAFGSALSGIGSSFSGPFGQALNSLGNAYGQGYNAYLQTAQNQYNNINSGFNNLMQNLGGGLGSLYQGYQQLPGSVLSMLGIGQQGAVGPGGVPSQAAFNPDGTVNQKAWGVAAPAAQAIADVQAQQVGQDKEQAAATGMGNTSELANALSQTGLQTQKAYGALGSNLAQTGAGYLSQLGLAGLGFGGNALSQLTGQGNNWLNWQNSVTAQPPSAADYSNLGQMAGQYAQAQANQQLAQQQLQGQLGLQGAALGLQAQQGNAQNQLGLLNTLMGRPTAQGGAGGFGGARPPTSPYGNQGQPQISYPGISQGNWNPSYGQQQSPFQAGTPEASMYNDMLSQGWSPQDAAAFINGQYPGGNSAGTSPTAPYSQNAQGSLASQGEAALAQYGLDAAGNSMAGNYNALVGGGTPFAGSVPSADIPYGSIGGGVYNPYPTGAGIDYGALAGGVYNPYGGG